jgi:lysozyme
MDGIDVSSWQPGNVVASVPHDFAIVKATQGQGYKSPTFDQQIADALRTGKAGAYHFDNGDANWRGEVDNFVRVIRPYLGRIVVVWDWEASAINAGSGRLSAILKYLGEQIGFPAMLYASGSPLVSQGGNAAAAANNCGVWCANYNLGYEKTGYRRDLKPYTNCVIHQYSSSGRLAGYGGDLDLNQFFGDGAMWDKYANGNGAPTPAPQPVTPAPAPSTNEYTVVRGDTLSGIGAKFGVDWRGIASANGIGAPYTIFPGQKLRLSGGSAPAPSPSGGSYTVVSGDTLSGIAAKFGTNWQTLQQMNGLADPNRIFPGQVLKVPGGGSAPAPAPSRTYTVQRGDTLSGIAAKFGTSWKTLQQINGLPDANKIYPGQVLKIG